MVKLLSLEASNFKGLNLQHPLEFSKGITLITGRNESGKSTILDAILFALFTRTIRPSARPRDEDILQYGANKLTLRLLFGIEDRTFLVERKIHRKRPNEASLSETLPNGTLRAIATKVNTVNDEVTKLLGGLTFDEIVASNVVAQKELNKILTLRLGDRIAVINAFLNLESFNEANQKLADERRGIEGTPSNPGTLPVARQRLEDIQRDLEEYKAKWKELEETRTNLTDLQSKTDESQKEYEKKHELFTKLETYQKEFTKKSQIASDIRNKKETLNEVNKQIDVLETKKKEFASLKEQANEYRGIGELAPTIEKLEAKSDELQSKQVQLQTKEKSSPIAPEALGSAFEEIQRHPGRVGIQQAEGIRQNSRTMMLFSVAILLVGIALGLLVDRLLFSLVAAGAVGFAYATMQTAKASTLMTQHSDYLIKSRSYDERKKIYNDHENSLHSLRNEVTQARNQLSQELGLITRYHDIVQENPQDPLQTARDIKTKFNEEKSQVTVLSTKMTQFQTDLTRQPQLQKQQTDLSDEIDKLQARHDSLLLPTLPPEITYSDELLFQIKTEDQNMHDSILKNLENISNMKEAIGKLTKFIEDKKELPHQAEEQDKAVRILERRLRVLNDAKMGVEKTSESLRTRVRPSVEYYMSTFLPLVTMNRYKAVRLDEDYRLSVWDAEAGDYRPREVFSGGTEDQLLLVMRLAFALALTPEARGTRPEFLFLDEPLGSSDEVRRDEIMQLLKAELAQYFNQIILVSHVQGLEQDVDHIVRLEAGAITEQL